MNPPRSTWERRVGREIVARPPRREAPATNREEASRSGATAARVARPTIATRATPVVGARVLTAAAATRGVDDAKTTIASLTVRQAARSAVGLDRRAFLARLPTLRHVVLPRPPSDRLVRADDVLLWPDKPRREAFFMSATPVLRDISLVVERDADYRTTRGDASIELAIHPLDATTRAQTDAARWTAALLAAGFDATGWRFTPLVVNRLEGSLVVPVEHHRDGVRSVPNAHTGTVLFHVALSSSGAHAWHDALVDGAPLTVIVTLIATVASGSVTSSLAARRESISAPLPALIGGRRPNAVRVVNPEVEVEAKLHVDGDPTVQSIAVDMTASTGLSRNHVFDGSGGQLALRIATEDPAAVHVDWHVTVAFAAASWPPVSIGGRLSAGNWSDIVSPSSWTRRVTVTAMLIGPDGSILNGDPASSVELSNRLAGSLDFEADFLEGTKLQTAFETSNQQVVDLYLPEPPGAAPGRLRLTVMSIRGGRDDLLVRDLQSGESWVLIKVFENARIQVETNLTAGGESGGPNAAMRRGLDVLAGA